MSILHSHDLTACLEHDQIVTAEDLRQCLLTPPRTVDTARGLVEYAIRGEGPPILVAHGGPGGYDQALVLGELFRKNGFRIIAPSRPGYLGTPSRCGATAEEQGDFMAALLAALDIPSVIVVGASGGGPAGYQLAQRHPERVRALLIIDGISMNYTKGDDVGAVEKWMYLSRPGQWLTGFLFRHFPASVVHGFFQTESTFDKHEIGIRVKGILRDDNKFAILQAMFATMSDKFEQRMAGAENDIAMGKAIDKLCLDKIRCPTLIVHGDADGDVPPRDAEYAHEAISGSRLLWIDKASHIGFWTADDAYKVQRYALDWLKDC